MKSNRRRFMQALGAGSAGAAMVEAASAAAPAKGTSKGNEGQVLLVGDNIAVANTQYGRSEATCSGASTISSACPMAPIRRAQTASCRRRSRSRGPTCYPALWWGNSAPQNMDNRYANKYASFRDHWNYDDVSEDCLRINVFTPAINDGKKRPVLFWIHGGGFTNGNGIEQDGYNGENFARLGNVVFCSINHRLGPLGYCNLAGVGGEKFAASGNVGHAGHRGGARMGARQHRQLRRRSGQRHDHGAVGRRREGLHPDRDALGEGTLPQGGRAERRVAEIAADKAVSEKLGAAVVKEAGLSAGELEKLQAMPWKDFYAVATQGAAELGRGDPGPGGWLARIQPGGGRQRFCRSIPTIRRRRRRRPTCR